MDVDDVEACSVSADPSGHRRRPEPGEPGSGHELPSIEQPDRHSVDPARPERIVTGCGDDGDVVASAEQFRALVQGDAGGPAVRPVPAEHRHHLQNSHRGGSSRCDGRSWRTDHAVRGDIVRHQRGGTDHAVRSEGDATQDSGPGTHPHAVLDHNRSVVESEGG